MKIWHITDSHGFHSQYKVPEGIDVVCFTGDESNSRSPFMNHHEFIEFVEWYAEVDIHHKLYIPGNHSTFVYHNERQAKDMLKDNSITWLHKTEIVIDGIKFYGDGTSPTFGNWVYMCKRETINRHWEMIPNDVEVLLTHSPPKGILDLSEDRQYKLERCGCGALNKRIKVLDELKVHLFGHIHNNKDIINTGILVREGVKYSNATGVEDGRFNKGLVYNGNIIEL